MARPICGACGGICIESVTVVEIRGPDRPPAAFVVCSDCSHDLARRLSKGRAIHPERPLVTITR